MTYSGKMDEECIPLCDALNAIAGVETISSCCGHGKEQFRIDFTTRHMSVIRRLTSLLWMNRFSHDWGMWVDYYQSRDAVAFVLVGPVGDYKGANDLAEMLNKCWVSATAR